MKADLLDLTTIGCLLELFALHQGFFHEIEAVLAEKHLVADEKGRRSERAAAHGLVGGTAQCRLDGRI